MSAEKVYLLDTNVLVHDPESIFNFENTYIIIPIVVLEELDKFKGESTERGYNARSAIRYLDGLREQGSLKDGVKLDNGSTVAIYFPEDKAQLPLDLAIDIADNLILLTALDLTQRGKKVHFISKDLNARVKADALGLFAQDYLKDRVSPEKIYAGWREVQVPSISLKKGTPPELEELSHESEPPMVNEFFLVVSRSNPYNYKLFRYTMHGEFKEILPPSLQWPLEPRNIQQLMALDLLLDEEIQFVSLVGSAGTGKTFLALLAGLDLVIVKHLYEKMLVSRPVIPLGPDIGYLPGTIEEKLRSWMQPVYDNMEFIVHAINAERKQFNGYQPYGGRRGGNKHKRSVRPNKTIESLEELVRQGKVSLEAITYMRGRSIPYQFIIIDEAQNLTPHEVKTLISRVGEGSKIVLAGDPYQIDSPYLDFSSNGLMVATEKFKGQSLFGTVFLESSERSELSKLVSELL